jgi:hypothetical protein
MFTKGIILSETEYCMLWGDFIEMLMERIEKLDEKEEGIMWIPATVTGKVKLSMCAVVDEDVFRKLVDLYEGVVIEEFDRLFPEEKEEILKYSAKFNKFFWFVFTEFAEIIMWTLGVSVVFVYFKKKGLYYPIYDDGNGLYSCLEAMGILGELKSKLSEYL